MPTEYHAIQVRGIQIIPNDLTAWGVVLSAVPLPSGMVQLLIVGQTTPRAVVQQKLYDIQRPITTL